MHDAIPQARALRKAGDAQGATALLTDVVRRGSLDALDYDSVGNLLAGMVEKGQVASPKLRVRLIGQWTTSFLMPVLTAVTWGRRQPAVVTEGSYDQVWQDLLAMQPGDADVIVLLAWSQRLLGDPTRAPSARLGDELEFWRMCWGRVAELGARLIMVGPDALHDGALGAFLGGGAGGERGLIRAANQALRDGLPPGAYFVDLEALSAGIGRKRFYEARGWHWTHQPLTDEALVELAGALQAGLRAVTTGPKKVLVLDLDNTLWGGVVGETGPLGVALGETPDGEAFRAFQAWCKALTQRGVLLAVASKNEVDDARGPFLQNPAMVLGLDDIAAFEASWEPKGATIARMAEHLSLGLDSFVFVDDNPAEREQVRQALPDVEVVDIPTDCAGYIDAVEAGRWFEAVALTAEDAARAAQYQQERKRRDLQTSASTLDDYLASLDMVGDVRPVDEADLPRVVQLIAKTNQWNLTTRRHGPEFVGGVAQDPRGVALTLRMSDRFGDHGLVAVVLGTPVDEHTLHLDTWLMSCRVIARTAEGYFFRAIVEAARARGYRRLLGEYLPTKKNPQVADLYDSLGFVVQERTEERTTWVVDLDALALPVTFVQPPGAQE
jgi:FkbH-like protein